MLSVRLGCNVSFSVLNSSTLDLAEGRRHDGSWLGYDLEIHCDRCRLVKGGGHKEQAMPVAAIRRALCPDYVATKSGAYQYERNEQSATRETGA